MTYQDYLASELARCFWFATDDEVCWEDLAAEETVVWATYVAYEGNKTVANAAREYAANLSEYDRLKDRMYFAQRDFSEDKPQVMIDVEDLIMTYYKEFCYALLSGIAEDNEEVLCDIFTQGDYRKLVELVKTIFKPASQLD